MTGGDERPSPSEWSLSVLLYYCLRTVTLDLLWLEAKPKCRLDLMQSEHWLCARRCVLFLSHFVRLSATPVKILCMTYVKHGCAEKPQWVRCFCNLSKVHKRFISYRVFLGIHVLKRCWTCDRVSVSLRVHTRISRTISWHSVAWLMKVSPAI